MVASLVDCTPVLELVSVWYSKFIGGTVMTCLPSSPFASDFKREYSEKKRRKILSENIVLSRTAGET